MADIRTQEDTGDICGVSLERCNGDEGGDIAVLEHAPDIDIALTQLASVDNTSHEEKDAGAKSGNRADTMETGVSLQSYSPHRVKYHRLQP